MDDKALITLLKGRDGNAVDLLIARHGGLIRYVAGGILQDTLETQACVNEVYLHIWEHAASFDPDRGSLTTWITALTRNAALNRARSTMHRACWEAPLNDDLPVQEDTPEQALLRQERIEQLQAAIGALAHREKALFYRKYYYAQSTAQIAVELGLTERSVEGRLYRLRKRLQKTLGEEWSAQ